MLFTNEVKDKLQEKYDLAVAAGLTQFEFRGHTLLVDYAKYLLEYLNMKLDVSRSTGSL